MIEERKPTPLTLAQRERVREIMRRLYDEEAVGLVREVIWEKGGVSRPMVAADFEDAYILWVLSDERATLGQFTPLRVERYTLLEDADPTEPVRPIE